MSDSFTSAQVRWAHSYDGYRRLASGPEALANILGGAREEYRVHGRVPQWCGVDLLRGWAFYLTREDRHRGGDTLGEEWTAVLARLRVHQDATGADRPPPDARTLLDLPSVFSTEPKRHKDSAFLVAKQARLWEGHVAPINQLVDQIRHAIAREWQAAHRGAAPPVFVPYVDPDSGGVQARVLFVLESPAGPAALGSGMLSADNNDGSAKNGLEVLPSQRDASHLRAALECRPLVRGRRQEEQVGHGQRRDPRQGLPLAVAGPCSLDQSRPCPG